MKENARKMRKPLLIAVAVLMTWVMVLTIPMQTASAKTTTVNATYKGTQETVEATVKANFADVESMPVEWQDYIKYLKEVTLDDDLVLPLKTKKDVLQAENAQTADEWQKNRRLVQKRKAAALNKEIRRTAKKKAYQKAREQYDENWNLESQSMGLPQSTNGSTKTYMDYTAVTSTGSAQYKLLNGPEATTKDGFRMIGDYYCVALGSYYGSEIGARYYITLSTGKVLRCILGDQKSDKHTNSTHQYAVKNKDIVEFIVDGKKLSGGDVSEVPGFEGSIVSIQKITDSRVQNPLVQ